MAHVFLSYVRENSDLVSKLVEDLERFDIDVWLDRQDIKPGHRWKDAIQEAINEGAFFIACFSKEYAERSRTYMNEELTLAIDELRQRPTDQSWFIPVLLTPSEIPNRSIGAGETLRSIQYVSLYDSWEDGIERILSTIQPPSAMVYQLMRSLQDPSARARIRAIDSLGTIGPHAKDAIPALVDLLDDKNDTVRAAAAEAVGKIGVANESTVLKLLSITGDDGHPYYPTVHANDALANMGEAAIPFLINALDHQDGHIVAAASETLIAIGEAAIPALTDALSSSPENARGYVAATLAAIGSATTPTVQSPVEPLIRILTDETADLYTRASAADALGTMDDTAAIPALVSALRDENYLCVSAALALGNLHDPSAIKPLVDVLRDESKFWVPRGAAAVALGNLGELARPARPALVEALDYDSQAEGGKWDERAHEAVLDAIRRIEDPSAPSKLKGKGYRYEMWGIY